ASLAPSEMCIRDSVGLVRELEPDAHANQVENAIAHGAELVPGRSSPEFGAGRINALNTVSNL
ncbi:peptidase S8 and S53 subtilisin kexin sedolisin, partial [Natrialba magadii ATCC 43099]